MNDAYCIWNPWSIYVAAYHMKWVFLSDADILFTFNLWQFYQMLRNCSTKIKIKFLRYEQSSQCKSNRDSSVSYASAAAKTDDSSSSWRSSFMGHSAISFPLNWLFMFKLWSLNNWILCSMFIDHSHYHLSLVFSWGSCQIIKFLYTSSWRP